MTSAQLEDARDVSSASSLLRTVFAVLLGVLGGLALTIGSLDLNRRGVAVGPWRSQPRDTGGDINPYTLAGDARAGLLPLGAAEGLSFIASTDSRDETFDARCDYVVEGPMPPTRYWTLSLLDTWGFPIANAANRYGFTSAEVLRLGNEPATITVSAHARSGNWLPLGTARSYVLMLRLYDTSLSTGLDSLEKVKLPSIKRTGCR